MEEIKFRQLRADEIELRTPDKKKDIDETGEMNLLLYQDARVGQRILDETVGEFGWSCNYRREGDSLFCGIAIKAPDGTWLWKWNAGAPSNFEATKGEASDAFKRACTMWGIGRSLYTAPAVRVPKGYGHKVSKIEYDEDNRISYLEIIDNEERKVFKWDAEEEKNRKEELRSFCKKLYDKSETKEEKDNVTEFYHNKVRIVGTLKKWYENSTLKWLWDKWNENKK